MATEHQGSVKREWAKRDVVLLLIALVIGFVLVMMGALAIPPLSGERILWALGTLILFLGNSALGILMVGGYIELFHPKWSRLHGLDYVVLIGSLVGLAVADGIFLWWVFSSTGSWVRWGSLGLSLIAMAVGGTWSRLGLWPHRRGTEPPDDHWQLFSMLSAMIGSAVGIVAAVALLVESAIAVNAAVPTTPMVPIVRAITGRYVAIGDSYSAGEGLEPFEPGTQATNCDRSVSQAYSELLAFDATVTKSFSAAPVPSSTT